MDVTVWLFQVSSRQSCQKLLIPKVKPRSEIAFDIQRQQSHQVGAAFMLLCAQFAWL
jgi:hypothetical protein